MTQMLQFFFFFSTNKPFCTIAKFITSMFSGCWFGLNKNYNWIRAWVSKQDSSLKFRNLAKKNHEGGRLPTCKILDFFRNLCFYEMKLPVSKKIANFRIMLDNFLLTIAGDSFPNAVQFENLDLSHRIPHILPVFAKIIVYLCKMIVDLTHENARRVSHTRNPIQS